MAENNPYLATLQWPGAPQSWPYSMTKYESDLYEKLGYDLQKTGQKIDFDNENPFLRGALGGAPPEVQLHNLKKWFGYAEPIYQLESPTSAPSPASMEFAGLQPQQPSAKVINILYRDRDGKFRLYNAQGGGIQGLKGEVASTNRALAETLPQVASGLLSISPTSLPTQVVRTAANLGLRGAASSAFAMAGRAGYDKAMSVAAGYEDPRSTAEKRQEMLGIGGMAGVGEVVGGGLSIFARGGTKRLFRGKPQDSLLPFEEAAYKVAGESPSGQRVMSDRIKLFNDVVGRPPSLGQVTQRGFVRSMEGLLAKYPWGYDPMNRFFRNFAESWGTKFQSVLDEALPGGYTQVPTGQQAGGIFRRGVLFDEKDSWMARVRKGDAIRYGYLDSKVPGDTPIGSDDIAELRDLAKKWRGSPNLGVIPGRRQALTYLESFISNVDEAARQSAQLHPQAGHAFGAGATARTGGGLPTVERQAPLQVNPGGLSPAARIGGPEILTEEVSSFPYIKAGNTIPPVMHGNPADWTPGRPVTLNNVLEGKRAFGSKIKVTETATISQDDLDAIYAGMSRVKDRVYNNADPTGRLSHLRDRADSIHQQAMLEWSNLLERVSGGKKPEFVGEYRVMTAIENLAKNASDEFTLAIGKLRPDEQQVFRLAMVNRIARAGEGAPFNPYRMVSEMQALPKESLDTLAPVGSPIRSYYENTRKVIETIQGPGGVSQNPLFVQAAAMQPAMVVGESAYNRELPGILRGIGTALSYIKVPQGAAKLLTNEAFVKWTGELTEAAFNRKNIGLEFIIDQVITHPARVAAVVKGLSDPDELVAFGQYMEGLFSSQGQQVSPSAINRQLNRTPAMDPSALTAWQGR